MAGPIELNLCPDERTLRQFGWIALGGFGLLALLAWQEWLVFSFGLGSWRAGVTGGFAGVAAISALLSLVWPRANLPLFVGLSIASYPIGFVLSYLIMGLLFFALITPIGWILRALGRDPLERRLDPEAESYWVEAHPPHPVERYFRQY